MQVQQLIIGSLLILLKACSLNEAPDINKRNSPDALIEQRVQQESPENNFNPDEGIDWESPEFEIPGEGVDPNTDCNCEGEDDGEESQQEGQAPEQPDTPGMTPEGCNGQLSQDPGDYILFAGESISRNGNNTIDLPNGWLAEEAWNNGTLGVVNVNGSSAITFGNEGQFHGFKFTPPSEGGEKRRFSFSGAEIFTYRVKGPNSSVQTGNYGLRVIKPGEFEGAGGAPTTTWMRVDNNGGSRFFDLPENCQLTKMYMPQEFLNEGAQANRLIWEMQTNWDRSDMVVIRQIVLKDFQWL